MKLPFSKKRQLQFGFGLIELMIALLLGIIIMLGVTEIATNNSRTRYEIQGSARQIENAAYAMRLLESDISNAAFWGERGSVVAGESTVLTDGSVLVLGDFPPVCPIATPDLENSLVYPLQGGQGDVDCPDGANTLEVKSNTDYLAIRRANSCAYDSTGLSGCEDADSNFHIQINACFVAANPVKPGAFQISDTLSDLDFTQRDCSTESPKYRLHNRVYFVTDDFDGDGDASEGDFDWLVRADLVGGAYTQTPLVEDVELLRFEYGLDDDGADGVVDLYADDPNDTAWPDVVLVKISMVVRNELPSGGFIDDKVYNVAGDTYCRAGAPNGPCDMTIPAAFETHRRQLYTRTVSVRNIGGRRET